MTVFFIASLNCILSFPHHPSSQQRCLAVAAVPENLSTDAIQQSIKRAWRSEGLRKTLDKARRRHEVKAVHGFRKFFRTYTEPKIGSLNAMILMNKFITTCATNYEKVIRFLPPTPIPPEYLSWTLC
jgi:hypothetical protein